MTQGPWWVRGRPRPGPRPAPQGNPHPMKSPKSVHQSGVIAFCGEEICLVTNGSGRQWTIPKGHVEPGMTSREAALMECFEEAGLTGVAGDEPVGSYFYRKDGKSHVVMVYLMHVTEVLTEWPEARRRHRVFLPTEVAAEKVANEGLKEILMRASLLAAKSWPGGTRPQPRLRVVAPSP